MHDPHTMLGEFRLPLPRFLFYSKKDRAKLRDKERKHFVLDPRPLLFEVWHHDPCTDGSDSSCWRKRSRLTSSQREKLKCFAWDESHYPYFLRRRSKEWGGLSRAEAEVMYRALLLHIARLLGKRLSFDEASRKASLWIHHAECTNPANIFCFLPGYHTNSTEDTPERREEHFHHLLIGIANHQFAPNRWWRSSWLHLNHLYLRIPLWQRVHRWLFERCAICTRGFRYGEQVIGLDWDGTRVAHEMCSGQSTKPAMEAGITPNVVDPDKPFCPRPDPDGTRLEDM